MASVKEYAYYIKGNIIKLVERDVNFDNDPNSKVYGPGVDRGQWKSPLTTVTDGLQLEYTYVENYNRTALGDISSDTLRFIGWGRNNNGKLLLFTYGSTGAQSLTGTYSDGQWVYVEGGRWTGIHKVQAGSGTGVLTTYTTIPPIPWSHIGVQQFNFQDDEQLAYSNLTVQGIGNTIIDFENRDNPYIFIENAANGLNNGLWRVEMGSGASSFFCTVKGKYGKNVSTGLYPEVAAAFVEADDDEINIYNAFHEDMVVYEGVDIMEDESFEIDLPDYLVKALEYYLKAHLIEDAGQIEMKEYYLKQFKKQIEKHATSRSWGMRGIASGPHAIR